MLELKVDDRVIRITDRYNRNDFKNLTVVRVLKQYVVCSDGEKYNLDDGRERGYCYNYYTAPRIELPSPELEVRMKKAAQGVQAAYLRNVITTKAPTLSLDKLIRISEIVNEHIT